MRYSLRTLLIALMVAPPILVWLIYAITSTWHVWPVMFALWPVVLMLALPSLFFMLLPELGPLLIWLFKDKNNDGKP
jgi:hypothetical protein